MFEFTFILMDIFVHFPGKTDIPENTTLFDDNYSPQICWLNSGRKITAYRRKKEGGKAFRAWAAQLRKPTPGSNPLLKGENLPYGDSTREISQTDRSTVPPASMP